MEEGELQQTVEIVSGSCWNALLEPFCRCPWNGTKIKAIRFSTKFVPVLCENHPQTDLFLGVLKPEALDDQIGSLDDLPELKPNLSN